jgi:hypothetical protein
MNQLASYIAGAHILAKYNKSKITAGTRHKKIIQFFKKVEKKKSKEKED